nr:hypothetical protein [Tanacetum cinerariifolium]
MNEAVKVAVQLQSDRLRDEAQKENDEFLKTIYENMQKIIKERVKEQVKVQVSKILQKIEQTVNEQLEAKVLTRSSNSSKTSYSVAVDLSEMELKKILIEKMEGNKSIHRSNEQRNLYKALVEAYESDKIILDTYGDTITLKRRHDDDADKDEEPTVGSDRGSKRRREGKEPEKAAKSDSRRMLCFQRLSSNVYKKHRNPKACGRPSTRDGTLTIVRTALDDRLKGIRMKYLPQTIWRKSDKERAAAMIQAIDKQLKTWRIMRSLERFVGGRLYEGDFRMLQKTI